MLFVEGGWTVLAVISLTLPACVFAESSPVVGSIHGGVVRANGHTAEVHVPMFEEMWKAIRTCNVIFYDPEKREDFEDGRIVRFLRTRGYVINDTGMGYFRVENLNEIFYGFKVSALTLPGEWGVYGMDISAEMPKVRNRLFPLIHFEKRIGDDGGAVLFATLDAGSDTKPAVLLTLKSRNPKHGLPVTTVACQIEYGD